MGGRVANMTRLLGIKDKALRNQIRYLLTKPCTRDIMESRLRSTTEQALRPIVRYLMTVECEVINFFVDLFDRPDSGDLGDMWETVAGKIESGQCVPVNGVIDAKFTEEFEAQSVEILIEFSAQYREVSPSVLGVVAHGQDCGIKLLDETYQDDLYVYKRSEYRAGVSNLTRTVRVTGGSPVQGEAELALPDGNATVTATMLDTRDVEFQAVPVGTLIPIDGHFSSSFGSGSPAYTDGEIVAVGGAYETTELQGTYTAGEWSYTAFLGNDQEVVDVTEKIETYDESLYPLDRFMGNDSNNDILAIVKVPGNVPVRVPNIQQEDEREPYTTPENAQSAFDKMQADSQARYDGYNKSSWSELADMSLYTPGYTPTPRYYDATLDDWVAAQSSFGSDFPVLRYGSNRLFSFYFTIAKINEADGAETFDSEGYVGGDLMKYLFTDYTGVSEKSENTLPSPSTFRAKIDRKEGLFNFSVNGQPETVIPISDGEDLSKMIGLVADRLDADGSAIKKVKVWKMGHDEPPDETGYGFFNAKSDKRKYLYKQE